MKKNNILFFIILLLVILGCGIYLFISLQYPGFIINLKDTDDSLKLAVSRKCLSKDKCVNLSDKIKELKSQWIDRTYIGAMYTLGKSAYLDGQLTQEEYDANNNLLMLHFSDFYDDLLEYLKKHTGKQVEYKKDGLLPGFHIFPSSYFIKYPFTSFHLDLQYNNTNWDNYSNCDFNNPITFTIPIEIPKDGAGLYFFDATKDTPKRTATKSKKIKYNYKLGKIIFHTGHNWHLIAPCNIKKNEHRITLQGHAIKCNDKWIVYW
jgi:hypothetical protein